MKRTRPVKHDIRMYLECTNCGNIFSVIKSGVQETERILLKTPITIPAGGSVVLNETNGEKFYLTNCSRCGEVLCRKTTRKAWMKSNEVRPDNAQ